MHNKMLDKMIAWGRMRIVATQHKRFTHLLYL